MKEKGKMESEAKFSHKRIHDKETGLTYVALACENRKDPSKSLQILVAPEFGSNLVQFQVGDYKLIYTDNGAIKAGRFTGSPVLWPLPNRYLRDGKKEFEFEGQVVSLEGIVRAEDPKSLIHGLVYDQPWQSDEPSIVQEGIRYVTHIAITECSPLYQYFPYKSELRLAHILGKDYLKVQYTVINHDQRNMPSVFALHPLYRLLGGREGTRIRVPAHSVMKATDELLPTGEVMPVEGTAYDLNEPKPVKGMMFDDVFTDLELGQYAYVDYPALGLRITHITSDDFTHAVVFTQKESDLGFVCLEPQTGATNAINLDDKARKKKDGRLAKAAHVIVIRPGESHTGIVKFAVEQTELHSIPL